LNLSVEANVARGAERDLLFGLGACQFSATGGWRLSLDLRTRHEAPSALFRCRTGRDIEHLRTGRAISPYASFMRALLGSCPAHILTQSPGAPSHAQQLDSFSPDHQHEHENADAIHGGRHHRRDDCHDGCAGQLGDGSDEAAHQKPVEARTR
jgi:hypothetical protein